MLFRSVRQTTVAEMQIRLDAIENANRSATVISIGGVEQLEERLAVLQRHVVRLEELIPAQNEVPSLLATITSEGSRLGVTVGSMVPQPDEPSAYYTRQGFQLAAIGEYHDIGRFITAIAALPRIITPVEMSVTRYNGPAGIYDHLTAPVVAGFRIETYTLPEGGPPPPAMGPGTEGG